MCCGFIGMYLSMLLCFHLNVLDISVSDYTLILVLEIKMTLELNNMYVKTQINVKKNY